MKLVEFQEDLGIGRRASVFINPEEVASVSYQRDEQKIISVNSFIILKSGEKIFVAESPQKIAVMLAK